MIQLDEVAPMLSIKLSSTLSVPRTMILFLLGSCKDDRKDRALTMCVISLTSIKDTSANAQY